jgi:hypothetical protein
MISRILAVTGSIAALSLSLASGSAPFPAQAGKAAPTVTARVSTADSVLPGNPDGPPWG